MFFFEFFFEFFSQCFFFVCFFFSVIYCLFLKIEWSEQEVGKWLQKYGYEKYIELFEGLNFYCCCFSKKNYRTKQYVMKNNKIENDISGKLLLELNEKSLREKNIEEEDLEPIFKLINILKAKPAIVIFIDFIFFSLKKLKKNE